MHPIICHEIQIINSEKDKQNITGQRGSRFQLLDSQICLCIGRKRSTNLDFIQVYLFLEFTAKFSRKKFNFFNYPNPLMPCFFHHFHSIVFSGRG